MRKIALLILIIALAFTSCVKPDDVRIGDITGINIISASEIDVSIEVENKSAKNFTLREMKFSIVVGDRGSESELIQGVMLKPTTLPRRFAGELTIPIRIRFENILTAMAISLDSSSLDKVYFVGYGLIKTGMVKEQRVEIREKIEPEFLRKLAKSELDLDIDLDKLGDILNLF